MNPLDYIWIALVMTLCTLSVYNLTREGQLLEFVKDLIEGCIYWILAKFTTYNNAKTIVLLEKYINKPLFRCPPCMASVWGSLFYWSIFSRSINEWIISVLISSILNKIIYAYVE